MHRLLVVSDSASIVRLAERALGDRFEITVTIAPVTDATSLLSGARTAELVLLDCDLESDQLADGPSLWDLISILRSAGVPIIAVAQHDAAIRLLGDEVDAVVTPDVEPAALRRAVDQTLARSAMVEAG